MQKRVAIWAAVSSLPQAKKVSLDDQLIQGRTHAEQHGAHVVAELVVPGESRDIVLFEEACRRIDAYAQLKALIDAKSIDVLIYLDRSRLGRTAALSMAVAELCNRANILLYETQAPPASLEFRPADHSDLLIGAIKSVDAQQEVRKIVDRHRKGMIGRIEKGKMPSNVNFGYMPVYDDRGKLSGYSVVEKAAETVLMIVSLYLNGDGMETIADILNSMKNEDGSIGWPTPHGARWVKQTVKGILSNVWRYAGFAELNVRSKTGRPYLRVRGMWPPIITEDQARRVIAERQARNPTRRSVNTVYRFTRMCRCYICDGRMRSQRRPSKWVRKDGTIGSYEDVFYRCPNGHVMISEKKVVAEVENFIRLIIESPEAAATWTDRPTPDQSATIIASIERLNAHIDKLTAGITKADIDYYGKGALDEDAPRHQAIVSALKKQIATAQGEITALQDRLHEEERSNQRSARIEDMRANGLSYLSSEDVRSANAWLRDMFRLVIGRAPTRGGQVNKIIPLF